jgi:hypothetical protein
MIAAAAILVAAFILPQEGASQGAQPNTGGISQTASEFALLGTNYWAVVRSNATLARGRGVFSVSRPSGFPVGNYIVRFLDNIRNCAYTATVGDFDALGVGPTGEVTTVGAAIDVRGVYLQTFNSAGSISDRTFHLLVSC